MAPVTVDDVRLVELPSHRSADGELVVVEHGQAIPYVVRRMFTVRADAGAIRGRHAHKRCSQFLVCSHGRIEVDCDDGSREVTFELATGTRGLLVPPGIWATERYVTADSVLVVLCDRLYEADDYLRDHDQFLAWRRAHV
ncbi:MAG: hypothetical protein JWP97_4760 [Labilithrix sp.]|nr:hypothetical protein [Labilithrix sp.]